MDKKSSFTGLVTFECPLRGEKKPLLEKENLDSVLKSISTSSLACILNLNMWILKIKAPQVKIFEPLKSCISKWENRRRMNWPPLKKYPSPSQDNFFPPPEIKNILTSPKNPKLQNCNSPLTLARGTHYDIPIQRWFIPHY